MARIGAIFNPYTHTLEEYRSAVAAAERSGLTELWIWEDCFRHSAFGAAGAALAWTQRLRIGIGIAPLPLRNVATTAMEIATLERLFPGRLLPGVGHGVLPWMAKIGGRAASPLTLMREYVPALRSLLAGEAVTTRGRYVTLDDVRLEWPPTTAPAVLAAAEGPKTLALSGEVADGSVLNSGYTPDEVAGFCATIRDARRAAGREGAHDIVAYVDAAFGDDPEALARAARPEKPDSIDRGVWGDPSRVAAGVSAYLDAGVDDVVLLPPTRVDPAAFFDATAQATELVAARGGAA
ncbi:LLM class flavin-dependent oxidoreductase [Microbacterium awajiense]|uniref:LLM class flavin-dependent oxidoreductase n=1 Tax=Microbacterium awajiense TaxID=415214 RepID=A0ABP7ACM8_9MICO